MAENYTHKIFSNDCHTLKNHSVYIIIVITFFVYSTGYKYIQTTLLIKNTCYPGAVSPMTIYNDRKNIVK